MFDKIIYEFFFINLNEYPNIKIDFQINVFLLIVAIAIAVCSVVITFYRSSLQQIIKQLTRLGAKNEDSARTLAELGLEKSVFIKMALSREGRLTRMIGRVGEVKYTYEEYEELSRKKGFKHEKIDFNTAKFYIREEKADDAKNIVENYGTSMLRTALYCVMIFAFYVCIALLMPEILSWVDILISGSMFGA